MPETPERWDRWTIDRYYTDAVQERLDADGGRPSDHADAAREQLHADYLAATGAKEPTYLANFGEPEAPQPADNLGAAGPADPFEEVA